MLLNKTGFSSGRLRLLALPDGECQGCIRKAAKSQAPSQRFVNPLTLAEGWQHSPMQAAKLLFLLILNPAMPAW
jgi:hypothetical protein